MPKKRLVASLIIFLVFIIITLFATQKINKNKSPNSNCSSVTLSSKRLSNGESLTINTHSSTKNIQNLLIVFSDRDKFPVSKFLNVPFSSDILPRPSYFITQSSSSSTYNTISVSYNDLINSALNIGTDSSRNLQVVVYIQDNQGNYSSADPKCIVNFDIE